MRIFQITTHLSEILEKSAKEPVVIFKYSNECGSSERLKVKFQDKILEKTLKFPIYLVTVQIQKVLSNKIEEWFSIKHESPQVLVIDKGKVTYTAHHDAIDIEML